MKISILGPIKLNNDHENWNTVQERKINIHINLLDCENCESAKENVDDASLFRYQIQTIFKSNYLQVFHWRKFHRIQMDLNYQLLDLIH